MDTDTYYFYVASSEVSSVYGSSDSFSTSVDTPTATAASGYFTVSYTYVSAGRAMP